MWANEKFDGTRAHKDEANGKLSVLSGRWNPLPFVTGHFSSVTDVIWGANGDFITSVSKDQTCRIFAPISNVSDVSSVESVRW